MSDRDAPRDLDQALAEHAGDARLGGPGRVLASETGRGGRREYEVATSVLVPVDEDDPRLRDVNIAVPVTARVEADEHGRAVRADIPTPDPEAVREARAFARNLIQTGAVKGLQPSGPVRRSAGPPVRPTHELVTDEGGAKVIRRIGFSSV